MGISLDITTQTVGVGSLDWLASRKGFDTCRSITLDLSLFSAAHYVNGYIPSGTVLSKITATGLYGPYAGKADEVQTLTIGGSGLTSFTVTYSGQTTASIPAAATAAQVQAALEALSNIGVGNISVSGNVNGPFTLRFIGTLKNTDVAQVTTTPTGGTGTVTPATVTVGGTDPSNGSQLAAGHLLQDARVADSNGNTFTKAAAALLWEGIVLRSKLPAFGVSVLGAGELDSDAETDLNMFIRYEA
jgi:hypothetical protein